MKNNNYIVKLKYINLVILNHLHRIDNTLFDFGGNFLNTAGIICEYNPIHAGHVFHISETRRILGEDCGIICAMSGNFVQRGEPAIFSKYARAKAAVLCGADLVIELPVHVCLSSAEGYAIGGVTLLSATGVCTHLSFGCECGDLEPLKTLAELKDSELVKQFIASGESYASAFQLAADAVFPENAEALKSPNNLLAAEYLRALPDSIFPVAVKRTGSEHDGINSASEIRKALLTDKTALGGIPENVRSIFEEEIKSGRAPVLPDSFENAVMYKLRTMSEEDYNALAGGNEGLGIRLMNAANNSADLAEVLEKAKTKRYTMSRLRRLVLRAYLGINDAELNAPCEYIRVLAIGKRGREILAQMKTSATLPVITKPSSGLAIASFRKNAKTDDLYALCCPDKNSRYAGVDLRTSPFVL